MPLGGAAQAVCAPSHGCHRCSERWYVSMLGRSWDSAGHGERAVSRALPIASLHSVLGGDAPCTVPAVMVPGCCQLPSYPKFQAIQTEAEV